MPDAWPVPGTPCPHGFLPGAIQAARQSLAQWPQRDERATCIFCGQRVDVAALLPEAATSRQRGADANQ